MSQPRRDSFGKGRAALGTLEFAVEQPPIGLPVLRAIRAPFRPFGALEEPAMARTVLNIPDKEVIIGF